MYVCMYECMHVVVSSTSSIVRYGTFSLFIFLPAIFFWFFLSVFLRWGQGSRSSRGWGRGGAAGSPDKWGPTHVTIYHHQSPSTYAHLPLLTPANH